jgi:hypothetical protein
MSSKNVKYRPLDDEDDANHFATTKFCQVPNGTATNRTLVLLLIFSSLCHFIWPVLWVLHVQNAPPNTCAPERSPYAGLIYDTPIPFRDDSMFVHRNTAIADAAWDSWTIEPGIVALPHDFVNRKMLPQAQASPLDENKGVYVLSSYHSLHCLVSAITPFIFKTDRIQEKAPRFIHRL